MDDVRVGSVFRAVRIRRGLRQADVAAAAGVSWSLISMIERGAFDAALLRTTRKVASVLGVSLALEPRWRGAELAKLLDERHAALVQAVILKLAAAGWQVLPEHTFNEWGETGSIDAFAWQPEAHALLTVEVKTALPDLQDLLATMDRKRRLAPKLARDLGWRPLVVGSVVALPGETWARNAVERNGPIFTAAFPARGSEVRRWIARPERDLRGVWFILSDSRGSTKQRRGGRIRVRNRPRSLVGVAPRSRPAQINAAKTDEAALSDPRRA